MLVSPLLSVVDNVAPPSPSAIDDDPLSFENFYVLYPRHAAKKAAKYAWSKLTERHKVEALTALVDWIRVWEFREAREGDITEYLPLPASWLNGERWEDDLPRGFKPTPVRVGVDPAPVAAIPFERGAIPQHVLDKIAKLKATTRVR